MELSRGVGGVQINRMTGLWGAFLPKFHEESNGTIQFQIEPLVLDLDPYIGLFCTPLTTGLHMEKS